MTDVRHSLQTSCRAKDHCAYVQNFGTLIADQRCIQLLVLAAASVSNIKITAVLYREEACSGRDGRQGTPAHTHTHTHTHCRVRVVLQGMLAGSSHESLDRRASLPRMKSYDAVVFDILRVSPEDFAVSV